VSNAIRDEFGNEPSATVAKIRDMFNRELAGPTDELGGLSVEALPFAPHTSCRMNPPKVLSG